MMSLAEMCRTRVVAANWWGIVISPADCVTFSQLTAEKTKIYSSRSGKVGTLIDRTGSHAEEDSAATRCVLSVQLRWFRPVGGWTQRLKVSRILYLGSEVLLARTELPEAAGNPQRL
jgi:hypothetical protein